MHLGTYRLEVQLGPGYPGDWYQAQDEKTGRAVRVLVYWPSPAEDADWKIAERRLRLLSQVHHRSVVPILDLHLDHESPFAVFPEPTGMSLEEILSRAEPWPEQSILEVGRAIASGLAEAHRLGLAHGNLSAAEIWVDDSNHPRIDFCGSREWAETTSITHAAQADASPSSGLIDHPAEDVRALGHLLYRMLHPVHGSTPQTSEQGPEEILSLTDLIHRMLSRDIDRRPSASDVRDYLNGFLGNSEQHRRMQRTNVGISAETGDAHAEPKRFLGRHQLLEKIGEGGLGMVYRARDSLDGKLVAIKIMHRHLVHNPEVLRRFKKEARLLAAVRSPNICHLYEANEDDGDFYLVMELLTGGTLGAFLKDQGKLPEAVVLTMIAAVARALGEAHRRGIVHRDIKPENIILEGPWGNLLEGNLSDTRLSPELRVKLCDFGLAREVDQSESLAMTRAEAPLGTPLYMAPEQAMGSAEITPRSDVYSLGVTLFLMLTGRFPFQASGVASLLAMHAKEEAPSPQSINPDLSSAICLVVLKTLAKDPRARYANAEELALDLERILRGEPTDLVIHPRLPEASPDEILHYDWSWELQSSPEQLWPFVSNTERLNRAVGLPAVRYSTELTAGEADGFGPRTDRKGSFRKAGVNNTWREYPFEWIEGKRMGVLREYEEGVFRWLASITELHPRADGGTTLYHRVRLVPRGLLGRIAAAVEVGFKGRRAVEKVYRRIDAFLNQQLPTGSAMDPFEGKPANVLDDDKTIHRLLEILVARQVDPTLAGALVEFIASAPEQEIARIRPIALASRWGLDADKVIDACLVAAHEGLLVILWDILCPKCRIPSAIEETMKSIRSHGRCDACHLNFDIDFAKSVEMILRVHPNLRSSEQGVFCAGGPAHSPHVLAQVRVAPGERIELNLNLPEGSYRIRGPQLPYAIDFRVHPDALAIRGELMLASRDKLPFPATFCTEGQTILLENDHLAELVVRVERLAAREDALTAARVCTLARFRELFPQEVLTGNQLVSVDHVTLLTTELVNADDWYQTLGDARAFGILHDYFRIVEDHIRKESGALVKTIHEGVLATFHDSAAAIRVALDLERLLSINDSTKDLRLRVGVHRGPAMVATLNGKLDYFGATVKFALSLPSLARIGEVVLSQPLASDVHVQSLLRRRGLKCEVLPNSVDSPLYRLTPESQNELIPFPKQKITNALSQFDKTPVR